MVSQPVNWTLDSRLEGDSVEICDLPLCQVRLMNDANYPWLLLVPRRPNVIELTDLAEADQTPLMREIAQAARALKTETACDKINIAAIGNVVAQLHVHVVARFRADPAWPKPVWSHGSPRAYEQTALRRLLPALRRRLAAARN